MPEVRTLPPARFPELGNARISRLLKEGERIWDSRPDLQAAFPDIRCWDFWFWLFWFGERENPELAHLSYPLPPPYLIHRVIGQAATPRTFVESGLWDWRRTYLHFLEGGFDFDRPGRFLDLGCGCGRILRHYARYAHTCEFTGADVDENAVAWCRENLDFAKFEVLPKAPPSPFPEGRFDAVLVFSVFTHLAEQLHRRWLEDLHRITNPGAVVVVTLQGRRAIDKMIARDAPGEVPSAEELRRDLPRILETGFQFYPYRQQVRHEEERNQRFYEEWDLEQYGSTFMLHKYFHPRWSDLFHIVSWNAAPDDWQDYVILRRLP